MSRKLIIVISALMLLAFTLGPFIWMILVSCASSPDMLFSQSASALLGFGGKSTNHLYSLNNYKEVLMSKSYHFLSYFWNSLLVSIITSFAVTLIASLSAYAVSRMRFPGRILIPLFVLAMSMFPPISIVGYLYRIFSSLGILNTHVALILPYTALTVPLALWITMSYFAQIPLDLDKAALVDGASRFTILTRIILPIALPGIFSSFLLVFIACFNEFLFALMLTSDAHAQTLPIGIAMFEGLHGEIPWGNLMAASTMATLPLVFLTLIFQKYIVQGLMGGAVKG